MFHKAVPNRENLWCFDEEDSLDSLGVVGFENGYEFSENHDARPMEMSLITQIL